MRLLHLHFKIEIGPDRYWGKRDVSPGSSMSIPGHSLPVTLAEPISPAM